MVHGNSTQLWRVRLFDGPTLESPAGDEIRRFRSLKIGALLAYLALRLGRQCPREELYAAIWPEEYDMRIVANRLRVSLASLRRQMEPAGIPFGSVLDASNTGCICLREETVWCDVSAFEHAYKAGRHEEAAQLLQGTLLPGYYDDWVLLERERFDVFSEELAALAVPLQIQDSPVAPRFIRDAPVSSFYPLPLYLTRFFGRDEEKQQLQELLCNNRLVTITGSGGMGKTRLAIETVRRNQSRSVFVALADVLEEEQIPGAILRTLGVLPSVESDLVEQLIAIFLRREPILLILDNAEHLITAVAGLALRLLEANPDLMLLVTSRQRLNIAGEAVLPLASLASPPAETPFVHLGSTPAVALFVDRARKARPDFVLTSRHADAMLQICHLVEGVPLALELAAARIGMQTPIQIAEALASGLLRLKSQQHGFSPRHRSLRASIQGSYDLLPPELQSFFASLSIFQGGWTPAAARFVTNCVETEEYLEELMRRSFLVLHEDESTGVLRCAFLESIRQFAAELLSDQEQEHLARRHAECFLTLAARVTEDDIRSLLPLDSEQENLRAALEIGWKRQTPLFHSGLIGALYYAYIRGHNRVFRPWAERAFAIRRSLPNLKERLQLDVVLYLILGYVGGHDIVSSLAEAMIQEAESHSFPAGRVLGKLILSYIAIHTWDYKTILRLSSEALHEARQLNDVPLLYRTLRLTAWYWQECAKNLPDLKGRSSRELLLNSKALIMECLSILPPHSSQLTFTLTIVAQIHFDLGNDAEGYVYMKSAQQTALAHGMLVMLIFCYQTECLFATRHAAFEYAALMYGAFDGLREKTGYSLEGANLLLASARAAITDQLGEELFATLTHRGEHTPLAELAAMSLHDLPSLQKTIPPPYHQ